MAQRTAKSLQSQQGKDASGIEEIKTISECSISSMHILDAYGLPENLILAFFGADLLGEANLPASNPQDAWCVNATPLVTLISSIR